MKLNIKISMFCIFLVVLCCTLSAISAVDVTGNTFTDLKTAIDSGDTVINLKNNITVTSGEKSSFTSGISISKPMTINGNGNYISCNNYSGVMVFKITGSNVVLTLNDITFKDINAGKGFISCEKDNFNLVGHNVIVKDSKVGSNGIIYSKNPGLNITGCKFINIYNSNTGSAGIIYNNKAANCYIGDCYFENCRSNSNNWGGGSYC